MRTPGASRGPRPASGRLPLFAPLHPLPPLRSSSRAPQPPVLPPAGAEPKAAAGRGPPGPGGGGVGTGRHGDGAAARGWAVLGAGMRRCELSQVGDREAVRRAPSIEWGRRGVLIARQCFLGSGPAHCFLAVVGIVRISVFRRLSTHLFRLIRKCEISSPRNQVALGVPYRI